MTNRFISLLAALFLLSAFAKAQLPLTGDSIGKGTRNLVVLIHGWNPDNEPDKYETSDGLYYLRNILAQGLNDSDWKLAMFHWEQAAATGTVVQDIVEGRFNADNATKAAEAGLIQGDYLALLLKSLAPDLRQVHLIAHSAGAWVAKRALEGLLKDNSYLVVQLTLLDPFIPDAVPFARHLQSVAAISSLASRPKTSE